MVKSNGDGDDGPKSVLVWDGKEIVLTRSTLVSLFFLLYSPL